MEPGDEYGYLCCPECGGKVNATEFMNDDGDREFFCPVCDDMYWHYQVLWVETTPDASQEKASKQDDNR